MQLDSTNRSVGIAVSLGGEEVNTEAPLSSTTPIPKRSWSMRSSLIRLCDDRARRALR